jgi:hypothetical protein
VLTALGVEDAAAAFKSNGIAFVGTTCGWVFEVDWYGDCNCAVLSRMLLFPPTGNDDAPPLATNGLADDLPCGTTLSESIIIFLSSNNNVSTPSLLVEPSWFGGVDSTGGRLLNDSSGLEVTPNMNAKYENWKTLI